MRLAHVKRPVDVDTFADLTGAAVTAVDWQPDGSLEVTFDAALTGDEERAVRMRAQAGDAAAETLLRQAWTAYQTNVGYLALPAPTQAQAAAQVAALTRQMQAVVRLLAPVEV